MEVHTGNVVTRPYRTTDMTWNELAGSTPVVNRGNQQPFIGCQTGGDKVADRLMNLLVNNDSN